MKRRNFIASTIGSLIALCGVKAKAEPVRIRRAKPWIETPEGYDGEGAWDEGTDVDGMWRMPGGRTINEVRHAEATR